MIDPKKSCMFASRGNGMVRFHKTSLHRFLAQNQNRFEKNYFEIVMNVFNERFVPFLTGKQELPDADKNDMKKVRFAQTYTSAQITEVWERFFKLIAIHLNDSFELERTKQCNVKSQMTLAPHQHVEEKERNKKRIQCRIP
ncbi:hypothetical protein DICVIV_05976 [Dictyocaulus viviparus]|uniref:Uncharacterized protein n=1 Tax=Dictyocaulus viviparus TaxID=29172 RepID=A0A0D8XVV3_DICVI|nr:hypothetical protein DICVIV_05976 [Dictyocaulus viviparus]